MPNVIPAKFHLLANPDIRLAPSLSPEAQAESTCKSGGLETRDTLGMHIIQDTERQINDNMSRVGGLTDPVIELQYPISTPLQPDSDRAGGGLRITAHL